MAESPTGFGPLADDSADGSNDTAINVPDTPTSPELQAAASNNDINTSPARANANGDGSRCPFPHDTSIPDSQPCEAKFLGMFQLDDHHGRPRSNACVDAIKTLATKRTRAPYRHGVTKHVSMVISCGNGCVLARPLPSLRPTSAQASPPKGLKTPLVQIVTVSPLELAILALRTHSHLGLGFAWPWHWPSLGIGLTFVLLHHPLKPPILGLTSPLYACLCNAPTLRPLRSLTTKITSATLSFEGVLTSQHLYIALMCFRYCMGDCVESPGDWRV